MRKTIEIKDILDWLEESDKVSKIPIVSEPEELQVLLRELSITEHAPDLQRGQCWFVYAQPSLNEDGNTFNVLIHAFFGQPEVKSTIEGLRLVLQNDNSVFWLTQSQMNHRGQIWFKNIPYGCYHAIADKSQLYASSQSSLKAAAASPPADDCLVYRAEDPRVQVELQGISDTGKVLLTASTSAADLAGGTVLFVIGETSGEVVLEPTGEPGFFRGDCELDLNLQQVSQSVPRFPVRRASNH